MAKLLHLDSSPLEASISRELTREFVTTWKAAHPGGEVIYRDVAAHASKPLDATWIFAGFTPDDARTPEQTAALANSEELIGELESADEYVLGVAMHNFSIPATLKLWIDQVARRGRTFSYGANGPEGLLKGKKATVLIASGGVYEAGTPMAAYNFVEPYLKTILGFIGVTDVTFVAAGGAAQVMMGTVDRDTFLKPTLEQIRSVAA
ncbi:FMN-dependent NADH-azoreductase [Granulicella sp. L60]|jgi:FMN-dependent NADH-azoreductase|uniref:FMN-dependent NADH-azoreductase n=1 Tax=Granulicella sp. L60 TaxID=1641866 RepID=UPI00131B0CBA|nr:NAD(P)H-dependent oxidoreductase [Granulicella sp. L60]